MSEIEIRDLTTYDEFVRVREIQQACWHFEQGEGLYPPLLNSAARYGGTVLGAFDGDHMVAFLFGFLGLHEDRRLKLCSQTMGVLPAYRNRGIAAQLKWAQRQRMLALGIDLITWTYDPLEAPNARLNLHTLGACTQTYFRNLYGENLGRLNQGLPSDRCLVTWWIAEKGVAERAAGKRPPDTALDGPLANACGGRGSDRHVVAVDLTLKAPLLHIEIPHDFQALKQAAPQHAAAWRQQVRDLFEHYFDRGYTAVDFLRIHAAGEERVYYSLRRST